MLDKSPLTVFDNDQGSDNARPELRTSRFDYDELLAAVRRQIRPILLSFIVAMTLGVAYLLTAQPQYTASTRIIIDSRRNQDQLSSTIAELNFDTGAIDSQVEVLKSDNVANGVIDQLKLETDPEFFGSGGGLVGAIVGALDFRQWLATRDAIDVDQRVKARRSALGRLKNNLEIKRVGRTYVLTIDYTSPNPDKAVTISKAFAEAYFADQLNAKYEETRRASGWLQDRIRELKDNALKSDLAVQQFMARNGLITTGDGEFVADQQMKQITSQVSDAHAVTAQSEAKVQQINEIIRAGRPDAAVTESLGSQVITDLRQKYLKASKTASELSAKLGVNHYQVVSLRNEMTQYERLIFEELRRISETYASDLEVARNRERTLNETMASLVGQKAVSDEIMVQLRELQREAETYKNLYQTFLQRYQDAVQKQSFPSSEARTISEASRPSSPSSPKAGLVLALSGVLGLMLGGGLGALREYRDRVFRSAHQVKDELGLPLIGLLQAVKSVQLTYSPDVSDERLVLPRESVLRYVIDNPLSSFAETLRAAKVEADLAMQGKSGAKIIGVVSVLPSEGKSTTAKNFASLLALQGTKTLLIDGDLRNPGLTRHTTRQTGNGLLEVLRGDVGISDVLLHEPDSGLFMLPAVIRKRLAQSSEIIGSPEMGTLLAEQARSFDYIVVDLPPMGPVIDVRAAGRLFDGFMFVIEWGKTPRNVVKTILADDAVLYDKCFGVILNKVDTDRLKLYHSDSARSYYYGRYSNYYVDAVQTQKPRIKSGQLKRP